MDATWEDATTRRRIGVVPHPRIRHPPTHKLAQTSLDIFPQSAPTLLHISDRPQDQQALEFLL